MKWLNLLLFALVASLATVAYTQDATEDEADVADDVDEDDQADETAASAKDLDPEDEILTLKPSDDAEVNVLFTRPSNPKELPAGAIVKFLVSFYNKGAKDFTVQHLEASFRYPQDYSFYIQNYTAAQIDRVVQPGHESTFDYAFMPNEQYAGRPLGLVVNLRYYDTDENVFENAVYNSTTNIIEDESGFNFEAYFLYFVFACVLVLLLLLGRDFLSKMRRKHGVSKRAQPTIEVGTNKGEVDFEWIPKDTLNVHNNKSPGRSPRNRKTQRRAGGGADE